MVANKGLEPVRQKLEQHRRWRDYEPVGLERSLVAIVVAIGMGARFVAFLGCISLTLWYIGRFAKVPVGELTVGAWLSLVVAIGFAGVVAWRYFALPKKDKAEVAYVHEGWGWVTIFIGLTLFPFVESSLEL